MPDATGAVALHLLLQRLDDAPSVAHVLGFGPFPIAQRLFERRKSQTAGL